MVKIIHKAKIVLSRSSTLAEVEVEDTVQVKDEVVVVMVVTTKPKSTTTEFK